MDMVWMAAESQVSRSAKILLFGSGSISFAQNVAVRPGEGQCQHQDIIVNAVDNDRSGWI